MKKYILTLSFLFGILFTTNAQILYKVTGNGLDKPSYLFGTHHLAPLKVYLDNESAKTAFTAAEQVVGEIDMTGDQMAMAMKMQPYMMAPADSTLSKIIPTDKFAEADSLLKNLIPMPGISLKNFEPLKPMVVTQQVSVFVIMQNMPEYKADEQLDMYFQVTGKKEGKQIIPLETVEQQAEILFNTTSIISQAEDMLELLRNPSEMITQAKKLNEAYFAEDLVALYDLTKEDNSDPEFFEKLLNERNNNWIKTLPAIMSKGSSFIAVGCLHLAGEIGLVEQLRKLGYTVEALN